MSNNFNPWLSLWTQPRATVRQLIDTDPSYLVIAIMIGVGAIGGLQSVTELVLQGEIASEQQTLMKVLGVVFGAILAVISLYLAGWLYSVVGGWLGGTGKSVELRTAAAWSNVPTLISGILILICYALAGKGSSLDVVMVAAALIATVFGVWQLIILCKMIGESHGFSAWKGLGTLIISILIIAVALIAIGLVAGILLTLVGVIAS